MTDPGALFLLATILLWIMAVLEDRDGPGAL